MTCHSVAVVLTPVHTKQTRINIHKRNNKNHSTNNTKRSKYKYTYYQNTTQFYIMLSVHHVMILGKRPAWLTNLFYVFIFIYNYLHVSSIFVFPDDEHDVVEACRELKNKNKYIEKNCASRWSFTKNPHSSQNTSHMHTPTCTHTHTLQNKLKQLQYKIHTKWNSHNTIKYPQYKVTLTHFTSLHVTELQEVLNFMTYTFRQIVISKSPLAAVMHKAGSIAELICGNVN